MDASTGQVALGIYAVLLAAGGVVGFVKAGSRPSLIAGLGSAVVALIALGLSAALASPRAGLGLGAVLAGALLVMFLRRFTATRKIMPSGVLAALSLAMLLLLGAILATS